MYDKTHKSITYSIDGNFNFRLDVQALLDDNILQASLELKLIVLYIYFYSSTQLLALEPSVQTLCSSLFAELLRHEVF